MEECPCGAGSPCPCEEEIEEVEAYFTPFSPFIHIMK